MCAGSRGGVAGRLRPSRARDQRLQGAVVSAYLRGDKVADIAKRHRCSPSVIYLRLRRAGVEPSRQPRAQVRQHPKLTREQLRARLLELRDAGLTRRQAAEQVGVSVSTVSRLAGPWREGGAAGRLRPSRRWSLHPEHDDLFWDAWSKALLARGLQETQVLRAAGMSRSTVAAWRDGKGMHLSTFLRLCDAAGVDPCEILREVGSQRIDTTRAKA